MNTGEKELDYDKLCQDPAYRAKVEAAHKAGLRIEKRAPNSMISAFRTWFHESAQPDWMWEWGWQYRIAPGQVWPIPTEQPERKAREWWVVLRHDLEPLRAFDEQLFGGIHVREVLPGDHAAEDAEIGRKWRADSSLETWFPYTAEELEKLRAEVAELKRQLAEREGSIERVLESMHKAERERDAATIERDAALIELGRRSLKP